MIELTNEQQRALDAATDGPARIIVPDGVRVLLRNADFDRIRSLIGDVPDAERRTDPRTQEQYALVLLASYERFKAFFEDDPISPEERRSLLRDFGKRAGWDDPAMDVYDQVYGEHP